VQPLDHLRHRFVEREASGSKQREHVGKGTAQVTARPHDRDVVRDQVIDAAQGERASAASQQRDATVRPEPAEGAIDVLDGAGGLDQHVEARGRRIGEELLDVVGVVRPARRELAPERDGLHHVHGDGAEGEPAQHRAEQPDRTGSEDQHAVARCHTTQRRRA
jgi:hypothetical protein